MNENTFRARRPILLATDLTSRCDRAFDRAVLLAREWNVPLFILHVVERVTGERRWRREELLETIRRDLSLDVRERDVELNIAIKDGDVAKATLDFAGEKDCGLIVTGTARYDGMMETNLGSAVEAMVPRSPIPVLIVKRRPRGEYLRIVIGSDFSDPSARAVLAAAELFQPAAMTVLNAFSEPGSKWIDSESARDQVEELRKKLAREFEEAIATASTAPGRREYVIEHGKPADVVCDFIADRDIDLAVLGTHGRTGLHKALIGSVAESLMRCVDCDVLMVGSPSGRGG
ncbi:MULTISPECIES: universal stress protein [unclassified Erythrobacter]|uniref:universal stress protein n=1 Tax=unclassified Erythrobacter TaxID=2633097 RepID=UPI00076BEDE7|nr:MULTISPECIES: universal stress protein [unclassified Erythrobacter]KWV92474.1 hypothetical protein ASS64_14580 [Erythrobacter sp. AP23]MBO6766770.1 universal stress protein [Erythrobacter sp.]